MLFVIKQTAGPTTSYTEQLEADSPTGALRAAFSKYGLHETDHKPRAGEFKLETETPEISVAETFGGIWTAFKAS